MPDKLKSRTAAASRPAGLRPKVPTAGAHQQSLKRAQAALVRADWHEARRAFGAALELQETPEALEGLGTAAWWLDDPAAVFRARERAYHLYRERRDSLGAARVATELAEDCMYFNAEAALAGGWLKRAQRLLANVRPAPEHGWLKLIEGDLALYSEGDPAAARRHAQKAQAIARSLDFVDLEMLALALEGLALVTQGRVHDGMPRLDEAATAALSGEMKDPLAIGFACCYLITACERTRDFERASQWCPRVQAFVKRTQFGTLFAICRIQYASLLLWRGEWQAAERELEHSVQALAATHPALRLEGLVRLAELRRCQGRYADAQHLLDEAALHPRTALERAALLNEANDARAAATLAYRFLRGVPDSNRTERIAGLDVLLRAQLALDEQQEARSTQRAIRDAVAGVTTPAFLAVARLADAQMAAYAKDLRAARAAFEDAIDLYRRSGAPYEQARAHLALAGLLARDDGTAEREARAAAEIFARLGAIRDGERARALLEHMAAPAAHPATGLTRREIEVLRFVAEGLSNARIAKALGLSEFTIKRHVANILGKLDLPSRAAAAAYAARTDLLQ